VPPAKLPGPVHRQVGRAKWVKCSFFAVERWEWEAASRGAPNPTSPVLGLALASCNLAQFALLIKQKTGKSLLAYNGYGCRCGSGGSKQPLDATDRCCRDHDCCYKKLVSSGCSPKTAAYKYSFRGTPITCGTGNRCQRETCTCDKRAVQCFQRAASSYLQRAASSYLQRAASSYRKSYYNYPRSKCKGGTSSCQPHLPAWGSKPDRNHQNWEGSAFPVARQDMEQPQGSKPDRNHQNWEGSAFPVAREDLAQPQGTEKAPSTFPQSLSTEKNTFP
uniref:Phospholipase A2 n=1 Tax=Cyanoderma ruficeps TaxID=181631 RepID=A0A8C3QQ66_9PASS